jgi:hypothetical protein
VSAVILAVDGAPVPGRTWVLRVDRDGVVPEIPGVDGILPPDVCSLEVRCFLDGLPVVGARRFPLTTSLGPAAGGGTARKLLWSCTLAMDCGVSLQGVGGVIFMVISRSGLGSGTNPCW